MFKRPAILDFLDRLPRSHAFDRVSEYASSYIHTFFIHCVLDRAF